MEETYKNDWRRFAVREMLRGFEYSEYKAALIFALSEANPGAAILSLMPDRLRFLDFLQEETSDFRTLYDGVESFDGDLSQNWQRYAAWYLCEWRGETVDIALLPNSYDQGEIVLISPNRNTLHDFAEAAHRFALRPKGRTLVYTEGWKNVPEVEAQMGEVTWDDIVLPQETVSAIREAIEGWAHSKAIYADMGFSWRRGVLLIGPPGTGKTMIGKAAASALPDLPVLYVRDLREHNYRDALSVIFRRARELAPCLLLLEDIDSILTPANRTVILNEMDGFKGNEGVLVIASTNHPHKIDEAFLKRPSRFDRVFHIGLPAEAERAEFCRRILARSSFSNRLSPDFDREALIARIVDKSKGFTPAYLKEALTGAALTLAHKGQADVLDQRYADAVLAQVEELKKTMRRLKDPAALSEMTTGETSIGYRRDSSD